MIPAAEEDWVKEYLDYKLAVRVVPSMEEALRHIARYSSGHSECIITENYRKAREFTSRVDAAAVYVNASTGLPTAVSSALAPRSAFPLKSSTPEGLWA